MSKKLMWLGLVLLWSVQSQAAVSFELIHKINDSIWGMDFLPDGRMIFSAREGKMFLLDLKTKKTVEIKGLPKIYVSGQGGLLDVRVHPDFNKNSYIYFTYAEPQGDNATTALMRTQLVGTEFKNSQRLFSGLRANDNDIHFGSRIEFDGAGHVFVTMGDRDERAKAQDLSHHQGKVLRLKEDGSIPQDNPFVGKKSALPEIWSLGHRNPQGLARHPVTGEMWEV